MSNQPPKSGRKKLATIPGLGYTLRLGANAALLPKRMDELYSGLDAARADILHTQRAVDTTNRELALQLDNLTQQVIEIHNRQVTLSQQVSDLKRALQDKSSKPASGAAPSELNSDLLADDHDLDSFYVEFENKFRGTETEIKDRLRVYVPRLKKLGVDFGKYPLLDIGCGRGELLELLKEEKINAVGLDLNESMVKRCNQRGLKAVQAEALSYLRKQPSASLGAITGFHIVEHIPFGFLLRLFEECYRVLTPGGVIIFETPDPENLHVGSFSFYYDPSHLHPLVPDVLAFAVENRGFDKAEILRLHPKGDGHENDGRKDRYIAEMLQRFYMEQDYAVIGYKAAPITAKTSKKK
jgi:SAM-dependent methyltransferase